jgi:hypothetical protein
LARRLRLTSSMRRLEESADAGIVGAGGFVIESGLGVWAWKNPNWSLRWEIGNEEKEEKGNGKQKRKTELEFI